MNRRVYAKVSRLRAAGVLPLQRCSRPSLLLLSVALSLFCALAPQAFAQEQQSTREEHWGRDRAGSVPRLLKHADALRDATGAPRRGTVGVTFAVYAERTGGAALWQETQNVTLDEQGRYSVNLGAMSREGLPAELFATSEPRWLAVQVYVPGDPESSQEQPRVLLVSVPYAMKAADAETLGGRPATDYVLREQLTGWSGVSTQAATANPQAASGGAQFVVDGSGTVNLIPKFTSATVIGDSQLSDNGSTVAIGTPSANARFEINLSTATGQLAQNNDVTLTNATPVAGLVAAMRLRLFDNSSAAVDSKQALRVVYRRQATATGAVNNFDSGLTVATFMDADAPYPYRTFNIEGPRVASGKTLQTLFGMYIEAPFQPGGTVTNKFAIVTEPGSGNVGFGTTAPTEALDVIGIVRATGGIRFGDGSLQTTAATGGGGGGSVTSIATGTGLTGGPITSTGTIAIDTAVVPRLGVANTFTANQTINGNLTLTGSATVTAIGGVFDGANGGVLGRDTTSLAGVGVQGIANGSNAAGVLGSATATTGAANVGVRGIAAGTGAAGVLAEATSVSGNSAGIRAVSSSFAGTAARFDNNAGGNIIEGRWLNGGTGLYEMRFRVDSGANVYAVNFKDLTTGKNLQLSLFCIAGQIMKYDGTNWNCATDSVGTATGGATIVRTNTFLGTNAGNASLTGNLNTAYGDSAMSGITSGSENTAFGAQALSPTTSASRNTAIGRWAMLNSSGSDNTVVGNAAFSNSTGSKNTAVGLGALANAAFVNGVVAIGVGACNSAFMNDICIGNGPGDLSFPGGTIRIGNTTTNPSQAAYIAGVFGQTASSGTTVIINSVGKLGTVLSSSRFKEDIAPIGDTSRKLMQLRPVQFHYKPHHDDGSRILQYGLIAEEVDKVFPELVMYGKDGKPDTVRYHFLAPLLLSETQRLQSEVTELRQALAAQSAELAELKATMHAALALARPLSAAKQSSTQPASSNSPH